MNVPSTVLSTIYASFHFTCTLLPQVSTMTISTVSVRLRRSHSLRSHSKEVAGPRSKPDLSDLNNPKYYCFFHFDTYSNFKSIQPYSYSMLFSFKYFLLKASMPRAVQKSPQPLGLPRVLQPVLKNQGNLH